MRSIIVLGLVTLAISLSPSDRERIIAEFDRPIDSLKSAYQVTAAKSILGEQLPESTCEFVSKNTELSLGDLYFASILAKLQSCQVSVAGVENFLKDELSAEGASMNTLYKAIYSMANFGLEQDAAAYEKISNQLKEEDTVLAHALAYLAAAELDGEAPKDLVDSIEDVAHRADTIGNSMSFEGGLMETALFLKGALALSQKAGAAALSEQMIQKFANYISSNKDKEGNSNLFYTLVGLDALSTSALVPTTLVVLGNSQVVSEDDKSIKLSLVNPLGVAVAGSTARIVSSKNPAGLSLFSAGDMSGSDGVFEASSTSLARGIFDTEVAVNIPSGYLAPDDSVIRVKCVVPVVLSSANVKLIDVDDNRVVTSSDLSSGPAVGKADLSTRFIFDFMLTSEDGTGEVTLHQAFVKFTNTKTGQNVYFIAQADLKKKYSIDLNFRTAATKSFGSVGGEYSVELIVGDATLPKAMTMTIAKITLELPESKDPAADLTKQAKPEITHIFREAEKRPPQVISMLFTGLIFIPVLILLAVWAKIGANVSNFSFSLSALGFHGGLLAIIAIYVNFFLGVNMFTTVKCLSGVAIITFLCGQRLLSSIAAARKTK